MRMGPTLVGLSLAAALFSAAARADGLSVSPTGLNLGSGDKVASLTVNSAGSVPTAGQVRVFRWLQKNGSFEYRKRTTDPRDSVKYWVIEAREVWPNGGGQFRLIP